MRRIFTTIASFGLIALQAQTLTFNPTGTGMSGTVQQYVVTSCVTSIDVDAYGSQGGNTNGGLGARIQGTFTVAPGDTIFIVVGQQGVVNSCGGPGASSGGGGGSFVWKSNGPSRTLLVAAGGGGGGNTNWSPPSCVFGIDASITNDGTQGNGSTSAVGGTGGNGGSGNAPSGVGSGGAGWLTDGGNSTWGNGCTGGLTYPLFTGGAGAIPFSNGPGEGDGGFGGGGGAVCGNGGGGGYSGGGGGEGSICRAGGGGGGSYNSGTNPINTAAARTGSGIVYITPSSASGVPPQPGAITGSNSFCAGSTASFSISSVPGANSYIWNVPAGSVIQSGQGTTSVTVVFGTTSGNVSVAGINACGTGTATNSAVTINALPVVALGPNITMCGSSVTLDAGNPGSTYMWSTSATTQTINVSASGTYNVSIVDANGCGGADTISVVLNANPVVALGSDITQCGGTATLDAGNVGSTYLWNDNSTSQTNVASASGSYFVTVTDGNGCTDSDTINVTINSIPTVTASAATDTACLADNDVMLTGSPAGGVWTGPGVTGNMFDPSIGAGTFSLVYSYTDASGCSSADSVSVYVDVCTAIGANISATGFNIFPNPSDGNVNLNITDYSGNVTVEVTDVTGRVVYSNQLKNVTGATTHAIDLRAQAQGTFIVRVADGTHSGKQQIQIVR
jgi:hypothetical protein